MDGRIFDIQRFSIHDGPGIRTTVFLKGCNLRCLWCHNPESQSMKNELMFYSSKCEGCGRCRQVCEHPGSCISCGKCVEVCHTGARVLAGRTADADEVINLVLRDREFYKTSGGGVTLSGGEPLLQIDFAEKILKTCKENGINTAVETAGNVPFDSLERILPFVDLFLFDIKGIDEENHKKNTGVSNKQILSNASALKERGANILFRMPVIPGCNDNEVGAVSEFAGDYPLELMAYHRTGCGKYTALGREYTLEEVVPPERDYMENLAKETGAAFNFSGI